MKQPGGKVLQVLCDFVRVAPPADGYERGEPGRLSGGETECAMCAQGDPRQVDATFICRGRLDRFLQSRNGGVQDRSRPLQSDRTLRHDDVCRIAFWES